MSVSQPLWNCGCVSRTVCLLDKEMSVSCHRGMLVPKSNKVVICCSYGLVMDIRLRLDARPAMIDVRESM